MLKTLEFEEYNNQCKFRGCLHYKAIVCLNKVDLVSDEEKEFVVFAIKNPDINYDLLKIYLVDHN